MTVFAKLAVIEARMFLREPMAWGWGLVFPSLLLVVLGGFYPGFLDPTDDLGGQRPIDVYTPVVIVLSAATMGVGSLPVLLATYRERRMLRRLWTTPIHPAEVLAAVVAVQVIVALVSAVAATALARGLFGVGLPEHPVGVATSVVLVTASVFALGLMIGARTRTASAAQGVGLLLYFPLLFFSGLYTPRELMSDGLRLVTDLTPTGAGVDAIATAWSGSMPTASSLAVMIGFAVIASALAASIFRWE